MMQKLIENFAVQLSNAMDIGKKINLTPPPTKIHQIVVAGLGGSGIGANLVESLIGDELAVPFIIDKTYDAPAFVNANTLLIACSFSGNTEETLSVMEQAKKKGAKICCISSGGKILEDAKKEGIDYVQIPNEAPCPRAFLGYSFVQQLYVLKAYGFISDQFEKPLEEGIELLRKEQFRIREEAQKLAAFLKGKLPIIYSDNSLLPVITRLQQQINENAKQLCHINMLPEMNHNELVGWGLDKEVYKNLAVFFVRHPEEHERVKIRFGLCKNIISDKTSHFNELNPQGNSFIAQNIYYIHLFDWISYYLAELNSVDPFPVDVIVRLKDELSKV